jgi:hypothetical protein
MSGVVTAPPQASGSVTSNKEVCIEKIRGPEDFLDLACEYERSILTRFLSADVSVLPNTPGSVISKLSRNVDCVSGSSAKTFYKRLRVGAHTEINDRFYRSPTLCIIVGQRCNPRHLQKKGRRYAATVRRTLFGKRTKHTILTTDSTQLSLITSVSYGTRVVRSLEPVSCS